MDGYNLRVYHCKMVSYAEKCSDDNPDMSTHLYSVKNGGVPYLKGSLNWSILYILPSTQ